MNAPKRSAPSRREKGPLMRLLLALANATIVMVLVLLSVGTYVYLKVSPLFLVKEVSVTGDKVLTKDEIILQSGITMGDNAIFLEAEGAEQRIRMMPYVKSCQVERMFPDLVAITIEERVAVATLEVDKHFFELDDSGIVLREINPGMPSVGALITNVPDLGHVKPGQKLSQHSLYKALSVWKAFSNEPMGKEIIVSEISAAKENDILMFCNEIPFEIRWGRGDIETQAKRLDYLWHTKGTQLACTEYLDLRFDKDLACK